MAKYKITGPNYITGGGALCCGTKKPSGGYLNPLYEEPPFKMVTISNNISFEKKEELKNYLRSYHAKINLQYLVYGALLSFIEGRATLVNKRIVRQILYLGEGESPPNCNNRLFKFVKNLKTGLKNEMS